jgi:hypothetical protein
MLLNMPTEIFDSIVSFLPTIAISNFRLTCRMIENQCWRGFLKQFNNTWQIFQTQECLDVLMRVSQGRLRDGIHTLRISTEIYDEEEIRFRAFTGSRLLPSDNLLRLQADQDYIRWTGWVTARLSLAFHGLSKLRRVEICLFGERNPELLGHGIQSAHRSPELFHWDLRDVFANVVSAADASDTRLEEIAVTPWEGASTAGLALSAFDFPQNQLDRLPSLFQNLRRLQLSVQMEKYESPAELVTVSRFISTASSLEELHLGFYINTRDGSVDLEWYEDEGLGDGLMSNLSLPKLRVCYLQDLELSETAIKRFVLQCPVLVEFGLSRINLCGYWRTLRGGEWPDWNAARVYPQFKLEEVYENYCAEYILR